LKIYNSMIRKTLPKTKLATFGVLVPHPKPEAKGFPIPNGTGFFINKEGYFITARHVIYNGKNRYKPNELLLMQPFGAQYNAPEIIEDWPNLDLALLKCDFEKVKGNSGYDGMDGFPFIEIAFDIIPEGTPVYAFGYPLSRKQLLAIEELMIGFHLWSPRTTSAIISSHHDVIGMFYGEKFPKHYVIDKALNYGNSGGPIVLQENGKVISVCTRFQPVIIPQSKTPPVFIPSLYGVTTSLKNIEERLKNIL